MQENNASAQTGKTSWDIYFNYLVMPNMILGQFSINSQGHNLYKLQYISLEEVKIVPFQQ